MPNQPTTFGFESEFQRNAQPLAGELHRRGLWDASDIHSWHCDCHLCEESTFKVQRDSTVDGEVISRVFATSELHDGEAIDAMRQLQEAAIQVDAEPGYDAGLHVHVARPRSAVRTKAYLAYLAWEQALIELAAGRFPALRSMNRPNFNHALDWAVINAHVTSTSFEGRRAATGDLLGELVDEVNAGDNERAYSLYTYDYEADRHAHLSTNTRFRTWEFRIWNSTRSAWRMELAVRYSLAACTPEFADALLAYEGERSVSHLVGVIKDAAIDDRLSDLAERQLTYMRRPEVPPTEFLVA